jgi:hypothetical protein
MCVFSVLRQVFVRRGGRSHVLLMSVRTEDTRFINRAFTLASSRCPKPGSVAPAVQPTAMTRQLCLLSIVSRLV